MIVLNFTAIQTRVSDNDYNETAAREGGGSFLFIKLYPKEVLCQAFFLIYRNHKD